MCACACWFFCRVPIPTTLWLVHRKLEGPNSLLQHEFCFPGSEPAGTKHRSHPLCGGTTRPASEMGAMIQMTLTKTPVPQKRQRADGIYRAWPPLPGIRSEEQLGSYFSQSLAIYRVSHKSDAVYHKPAVHIASTRHGIHISPPFSSPLKREVHRKC